MNVTKNEITDSKECTLCQLSNMYVGLTVLLLIGKYAFRVIIDHGIIEYSFKVNLLLLVIYTVEILADNL